MKIELQDMSIVVIPEQLLKIIDGFHSFPGGLIIAPFMHSCDQNILIVRPVKECYHPFCGNKTMNSPQKIMRQFFLGRGLERSNINTLRVHAGKYISYHAIL